SERRGQNSRIDACDPRAQASCDHLPREVRRVASPERKDRRQLRGGELLFAISADVLEKKVTEGAAVDRFFLRTEDRSSEHRLVLLVRAWTGNRQLPKRQARRTSLCAQQLRSNGVHRHAIRDLVD